MKVPVGIAEVLEKYYNYEDILTLIKSVYDLIQVARCWFKEYTNKTTLKAEFKQCKTYPSLLYRVNEIGTSIVILYIYKTLEIGYKPELVDTIECIKK